MSNYKIPGLEPQTLEEPAAMAYGMELSAREHVMASTVSVDEYFDELIEQVFAHETIKTLLCEKNSFKK